MKKIAIHFSFEEDELDVELKSIAQQLQRFIIEDDYKLQTIIHKIMDEEMIVLDIGMEEAMPLFEDAVDEFEEANLSFILYKQSPNGWQEVESETLIRELDRTPKWIINLIAFNLLWIFVMSCLQFFPIYKFYDETLEMGVLLTLLSTVVTGLVPFVNSTLAYMGAVEFYEWQGSSALFAFFGYYLPLLGFIVYLAWIFLKTLYSDRWYRFWRPEFN